MGFKQILARLKGGLVFQNPSDNSDSRDADHLTDSINNSPEIIYTIDSNYVIDWANQKALEINPKLIGRKCYALVSDTGVNCQDCKCQAAIDSKIVQNTLLLSNLNDIQRPMTYWNETIIPFANADHLQSSAMIILSQVGDIQEFKNKELNKVSKYTEDLELEKFVNVNFENIFNNLHIPICLTGNNLRVKFANSAFLKILDLSEIDIKDEVITDIIPEINTIGTQKILTLVVSGNNEQTYLLNLEQLATPRKVKLSISPIKFTDAKINGLIWKLEIFQQSQYHLPDLQDKSVINNYKGIMTVDAQGRVVEWNEFMTNLFGWTENEIIGVVNPVITVEYLRQLISEGNASRVDVTSANKLNERVDLRLTAIPTFDNSGAMSSCICLIENTTFDKYLDSHFKELEDRYNNLIKRFEWISFKFDSNFKPLQFIGSILQLTGYTDDEFVRGDVSFRDIIHEEDIILLDDMIRKMSRKVRTARELELRIISRNEAVKWVHFHFQNTFDDLGNILEINGYLYNITQRKEVEEELKHSREQFRTLAMYVEKAREEEKKHLALEIHDELGHALTALKLELAWVMKKKFLKQELMFEKVRKMNEIIESTIRKVRSISSQLRPSVLDHFGLEAALEWQVGEFQKRSAVRCKLQLDRKEIKINEQTSTAIFRIFQEILTNIAKHAKATRVDVIFEKTDKDIILKVRDNGKGFNTENIKYTKSLGILGMTERANAVGGTLAVNSVASIGTTVTLVVPLINIEG